MNNKIPFVVEAALDILEMHRELNQLRQENAELREYREKYTRLLDSDIKHGEKMAAGLLKLALSTAGETTSLQ